MTERDDVKQVREDEERRSKRPRDLAALKRREELLKYLRSLIQERTETRFKEAIRGHGLRDGTEAFEVALRIWRDAQRKP